MSKFEISKIITFVKKHKIHILLLLLMSLFIYVKLWDFFSVTSLREGDSLTGHTDALVFFRQSVLDYHEFPLWFPTAQAGTPFFGHHLYQVISYPPLVSLLMPYPAGMYNFSQLIGVFLCGLFMYILMLNLGFKPRYAFVSGLFYMFSPFVLGVVAASTEMLQVCVWTPLIFLFLWNAVTKKEWIKNSIFAGIVLGIVFLGGGYDASIFLVLIFISVFLVHLFGKNFTNRLVKIALISIIIFTLAMGLFAVRLLPLLEYHHESSKSSIESFSYEYSGAKHNLKKIVPNVSEFFKVLLLPLDKSAPFQYLIKIGISGLVLLLFSFVKWRKKLVLSLILIALLNILVAWPTHLWYLFWRFFPFFDGVHHLDRSMFLYCFATSVLIGIGCSVLFSKLAKKIPKKKVFIVFIIVVCLILGDLFLITGHIKGGRISEESGQRFHECFEENYMMHYMSEDPDIFRITSIKAKSHSGRAPVPITILGLEMIYGGSGAWFPELYNYLGIAHSLPAKFYGMLNTKYVYSDEPINQTGLVLHKKFEDSEACRKHGTKTDGGINGPYLYLNELFLPRAYIPDHSILVVGDKEGVDQTTYALMMSNKFDPSNTVIIMEYKKVDSFDLSFLQRFDAVILSQNSVTQGSGNILKSYIDNGGQVLPNIVEGKNSITQEDINLLLESMPGDYSNVNEPEISTYTPSKRYINLEGQTGWLVLAEKFHMFQGWEPKINGEEKPIFRANGMNSAVWIEGETGEIKFKYFPDTFRNGLLITLLTILIIIGYFVYTLSIPPVY